MLKIELSKLQFYGYHGVNKEEHTAGGDFEVELSVSFEPPATPVQQLSDTIDYTQLYALVKERMNRRAYLIETLAMEIAQAILQEFPVAAEAEVSVKKLHPPIPFFSGSVAATYIAKRNK